MRARIEKATRAVDAWFLEPHDATWAVLLRLVLGVILTGWFAQVLRRAPALLGPNAVGHVVPPSVVPDIPWLVPKLTVQPLFLHIGSDAAASAVAALCLGLAILFTLGFFTRTVGGLLIVAHLSVWGAAPLATYGWPQEYGQDLALLLLANPGRYGSVDAWLRQRRGGAPWWQIGGGPGWPRRLIQIQLACMYAAAGIPRLDNWAWMGGHTVFVAVSMNEYARLEIDWWPLRHVLKLGNWFAFFIEPFAAFALWVPALRNWVVLGLLGMHLGLELSTHVGWWQWTMAGALLSFVDPGRLRRLWPWNRRA